jgi:acetoacetate decarboxylase
MSYPPAPWHLYGNALQSFHAIDAEKAKQFVPLDFDIVSVLPGKTVGSLYLSVYEPHSTLQYHELIVVPALVRHRGKIGAWISHIYVDNLQSIEGGRNIWGLPKQMADFAWDERFVSVSRDNNVLCSVDRSSIEVPLSFWGKIDVSADVFGGLVRDILAFQGNLKAVLKWSPFRLSIPTESPLAAIDLGDPLFTVCSEQLHLIAHPPSIVGSAQSSLSDAILN